MAKIGIQTSTGLVGFSGSGGGAQTDTLPTPGASYLGQIYQYTGTTTQDYTHGYFYECVENSGVYSWEQTNVQPSDGAVATAQTKARSDIDFIAMMTGVDLDE